MMYLNGCPSTRKYTYYCLPINYLGVNYTPNYMTLTGSAPYASAMCYANDSVNKCPDGQTWINEIYPVQSHCGIPPNSCNEPINHPCDQYDAVDGMKAFECRGLMHWDSTICDYVHNNGCTTEAGYSGPFGGYYDSRGESLGDQQCIFGCTYTVDEVNQSNGGIHVALGGSTCTNGSALDAPDNIDAYDDETITDNGSTWEPDNDLDPSTNCGEFNGEYVCVDSVPDGECVTTPGGAYFCSSPPPVVPNVPNIGSPDISIDIPGDDLESPLDDRHIDMYPKPYTPTCPDGSTYQNGQCVRDPVDGACPSGYTLYNGKCVFDQNLGGPFKGPNIGGGAGLGEPPSYSFLQSAQNFMDTVENAPILNFAPNCTISGSCSPFVVLGVSTSIHCTLLNEAKPILQALLYLSAGLLAIRVFLSA